MPGYLHIIMTKKSMISKNNYRELLSSNAFFWVFFWWFYDLFVPDMQHLPSIYHNNPTVRIFVAIAIFWDHTFFWLTLYIFYVALHVNFLAFYYIFTTYLKNSYIFHENVTLNNEFYQIGILMLWKSLTNSN